MIALFGFVAAAVAQPTGYSLSCVAVSPQGSVSHFEVTIAGEGASKRLGVVRHDDNEWATAQTGSSPVEALGSFSDEFRVETAAGHYIVHLARTSAASQISVVTVDEDKGTRALNRTLFEGICRPSTTTAPAPPAAPAPPVPPAKFSVQPITMRNSSFPSLCHLVTAEQAVIAFPMTVSLSPAGVAFDVPAVTTAAWTPFRANGASMAGLTIPASSPNTKLLTVFNSASSGDYQIGHTIVGQNEALDQWFSISRRSSNGAVETIGAGGCNIPQKATERG
jgi:hypothetical protein